MRIAVDLQACQTAGSRNRGIGRYSMALIQAMARQAKGHDLRIVLNAAFADTIEPIRHALDGLVSPENIVTFHLPGHGVAYHQENTWQRLAAERMRQSFLESLAPDIVHVSSLFEGLGDDAVTSAAPFSHRFGSAVTLYDLIPLLHEETYLANPLTRSWYYDKLETLKKAELLLAISGHSRQEAIDALSLPEDHVVNISSAVDPIYRPLPLSAEDTASLKNRYGLTKPFLMYTGGIDYRKNIEGLIEAFSLLPGTLRERYQLAIVCKVSDDDRQRLGALARRHHLAGTDVVFTGYVSDEDLVGLYNITSLFVFPSLHEGFGLPALEAMACGAPVISSNTSSLPEVIGRTDALFDPSSVQAIATKMASTLSDDAYLAGLREHGLQQARLFSWDASAKRALEAFEHLHARRSDEARIVVPTQAARPRLAYVSPLPSEQSGIANYSAELLPQLAMHYDIDVIVDQPAVDDAWINATLPIRSPDWFEEHAEQYERVVYHIGNSALHKHMFAMLARHPGVVVLHDFFLGGLFNHLDAHGYLPGTFLHTLYESHGYHALIDCIKTGPGAASWKYPCNKSVLDNALGIIVHSDFSLRLAQTWYGDDSAANWRLIPHLRVLPENAERNAARKSLGLTDDDFLVCSFGLLGPTKLNDRLLRAWLQSPLAQSKRCHLVFVGQNNGGEYGMAFTSALSASGCRDRIKVTGYASQELYCHYLAAADAAVQLRANSRGETSGTILDCLAHEIPTIINAHGSSSDLPGDVLIKLPDEFADTELRDALAQLWSDTSLRQQLAQRAVQYVRQAHDPVHVGTQYRDAIENFARHSPLGGYQRLIRSLATIETDAKPSEQDLLSAAAGIALNQRPTPPRQILVDISELVQQDAKSGIQRVVHNILNTLLTAPPDGYRVEPVYVDGNHYVYARNFILASIGVQEREPWFALEDAPIEVRRSDIFLGLDLSPEIVPRNRHLFTDLRNQGVKVHFIVYDLLPALHPELFAEGVQPNFVRWLETVATLADGLVCISRSVADELLDWLATSSVQRLSPLQIGYFHLGADIAEHDPAPNHHAVADLLPAQANAHPAFLMVGTLEPRKGHAKVLSAFETLWAQGVQANLVIVGKQGWMVEQLVAKLSAHPEKNKRLFWFESASDALLLQLYQNSAALLAPSEGEGFGLPLIEAARHHLPIIASDLPVFREVAGEHALYFSNSSTDNLVEALQHWLMLNAEGNAPASAGMPWLTWAQSAEQLLNVVDRQNWYRTAGT